MKKIITVALYLLISIGMYSQDMKDVYKNGIKKNLEKGNCEKAEEVYKVAIENKVLKADADIESRIAECKGSTLYQSHNGHEYVDLGLPSGIKWATCNVGANSPEEYGDYFAWGETSPKSSYTESNYTYSSNPPTLPLSADAANVNWGGSWRMPTKEEQDELRNNCTWTWASQNGVNGYKVTSKKNGNSIFLPAAGTYDLYGAGQMGHYWSSSLDNYGSGDQVYNLLFFPGIIRGVYCIGRPFNGQSVRPVCDSTINNSSNYTNNQSYVSKDYVENAENLNMKMVYVEGGTFTMEAKSVLVEGYENEDTLYNIKVHSYYIGEKEVTQSQWRAVMGSNPSYFTGDNNPVENISWNDAQAFCQKLSNITGKTYCLPTESQWQYAARGGNKSKGYKYSGSNSIDTIAWYASNSGGKTHPVGWKRANELGIYDMSGNVWEFCSDYAFNSYDKYKKSEIYIDWHGDSEIKIAYGGSYFNISPSCCNCVRLITDASDSSRDVGFRVVCLP